MQGEANGKVERGRQPCCHCEAPKGPWRPEREARGSALGVQSRGGSCDFADGFPVIRPGTARLPRRFAPRNDTSGRHSDGNGAAHRIGGTTAASRTGGACPAPTGPVRIERRPAYDPFFILQYSLFIISSIPLRGMANHMTKRPEIPCLSCKFPQSRRICH